MASRSNIRRDFLICASLVILTLAVFWPVTRCDFVTLDDPSFVVNNPGIQHGFTWESVRWAFTTYNLDFWHPLTWLSYMLDCRLFGLKPAGYHLMNLLLHLASVALIFLALKQMTGASWRSAFVAALFALHPLHVEPVAWVAERKDVLSTFFWALTVLAYVRYAARPNVLRHLPVFGCFALGLLAKPMHVTLPFLLLLLDFWPLKRFPAQVRFFGRAHTLAGAPAETGGPAVAFPRRSLAMLAGEKVPLLVLSAASVVVTLGTHVKAMVPLTREPFIMRLCNAALSYLGYMVKMVWPAKLVVFYPLPQVLVKWHVVAAVLVLASLSLAVVWQVKRRPYLVTGWFWFLGTLVPVIGIVQVGFQSQADRFTYVPLVGLFIVIAWGAQEIATRARLGLAGPGIGAVLAILACLLTTRAQLAYWRNGVTLFKHAVRLTTNNCVANYSLGNAYVGQGRIEEAREQFALAVQIDPAYAEARHNLANALFSLGRAEEWLEQRRAVVKFKPQSPSAWYNLAFVLMVTGRPAEAVTCYREAIRLRPDWPVPLNDLAWILATSSNSELRNGAEAVQLAGRACEITGGQDAHFLGTLDAAYAEAGRFSEAISIADKVRALALATAKTSQPRTRKNGLNATGLENRFGSDNVLWGREFFQGYQL